VRLKRNLCILAIAGVTGACARVGTVFVPGNDVTPPVVVSSVRPTYTPGAMRARIAGQVLLDCTVRPDGSVGDVAVTRSLDAVYGLDSQATQAVKQWVFTPGTRRGKPVAVRVPIALTFTLH
jgi:TonB family protein